MPPTRKSSSLQPKKSKANQPKKSRSKQGMEGGLTPRQAVAVRLEARLDREASKKFGHASFETDAGKVFCFVANESSLALKLPADRIAELIEAGQATPLRMGTRSMREWAIVPGAESPATLRLLHEAQRFVEALPLTLKRKPAGRSA